MAMIKIVAIWSSKTILTSTELQLHNQEINIRLHFDAKQ